MLYGLTWIQVATAERQYEAEAVREARWALDRLGSPDGTAAFDAGLTPRYGIFHAGWTNYLRAAIATLDDSAVADLTSSSIELAKAFGNSGSPDLPAYPGQSWPVDSTVAVASLALHDQVTTARFGPTRTRWLRLVKERLDPATGLIPHQAEPAQTGARATSQSMILRFLPEIDGAFARSQYGLFRDKFATEVGVREYPEGMSGPGDVDSGPLVFGISLSATVVTVGAARLQGDPLEGALARAGELLGVPVTGLATKRYAFGLLPIGDAFVVWATTTPSQPSAAEYEVAWWWRVPWLLLCWLPALVVLLIVGRRRHAAHH